MQPTSFVFRLEAVTSIAASVAVASVSGIAWSQTPSTPTGPSAPPSAAPAPTGPTVPLNRWLIVTESSGKGLRKGGGVLLRASGFDTAEGGKGSTNPGDCASEGATYTCSNGLAVKALGADKFEITAGPIKVSAKPATEAEGKTFAGWVEAQQAQSAACVAAAECCMASEAVLGKPCDLNKVLGDRKLATCQAALEKVRAEVTAKTPTPPAACAKK